MKTGPATATKLRGWLPLGGRIVRAVGQRVTGPLTLSLRCAACARLFTAGENAPPRGKLERP